MGVEHPWFPKQSQNVGFVLSLFRNHCRKRGNLLHWIIDLYCKHVLHTSSELADTFDSRKHILVGQSRSSHHGVRRATQQHVRSGGLTSQTAAKLRFERKASPKQQRRTKYEHCSKRKGHLKKIKSLQCQLFFFQKSDESGSKHQISHCW